MSMGILLSFILTTVVMMLVGLAATSRSRRTSADYLLSDRDNGPWVSALTMVTSDASGWVVMGLVGVAFSQGLSTLWVVPAAWIGYFINWWLLYERVRNRSSEQSLNTVPELLASAGKGRLAKIVRFVASAIIILFLTTYLAGQFTAAGKVFRVTLGAPPELGMIATIVIISPYIVLAGMRGVVWTDVFQAILIFTAVLIVPSMALWHAGGITATYNSLKNIEPSLVSFTAGKSGWDAVFYVIFWLSIGLAYPGQPHLIVRAMAAKNERAIQTGRIIAILWVSIQLTMAVIAGLAARVAFNQLSAIQQDPEQTLPAIASAILPAVLAGMVIAAVFAEVITTANSQLFSVLSTAMHDLPSLYGRKPIELSIVGRMISVVIVGGIAVVLAELLDRNVFTMVLSSWSILGGSFGPSVVYLLWVRDPKPEAVLAGMLTGCMAAIITYNIDSTKQIIISISVAIIVISMTHIIVKRLRCRDKLMDL